MRVRLTEVSLFLLFFLVAGCAPAQQRPVAMPPPPIAPVYEKGVVKASARLREAPSKQAKVLNTVAAGTEVKIIQTLDDWYKISTYDGREGYIYHKLVQIASSGSTASLAPVNTPPGRLDPPIAYFVIRDARLRSGPATHYEPPVATIKAGSQFIADGYSGSWYHGTVQNRSGWLSASLLDNKLHNNNPRLPVQQRDNTGGHLQQQGAVPAPVEQPPSEQKSPEQTVKMAAQPSQNKAPVPAGKARISALSPAKLRSHPSQFGKVLEEIPAGCEVAVLESQGSWCKIKTAHNVGFVATDNLSLGGE
jgi:SH3-like domain-containing protein